MTLSRAVAVKSCYCALVIDTQRLRGACAEHNESRDRSVDGPNETVAAIRLPAGNRARGVDASHKAVAERNESPLRSGWLG